MTVVVIETGKKEYDYNSDRNICGWYWVNVLIPWDDVGFDDWDLPVQHKVVTTWKQWLYDDC